MSILHIIQLPTPRAQKRRTTLAFLPLAPHRTTWNFPGSLSGLPGGGRDRNQAQKCAEGRWRRGKGQCWIPIHNWDYFLLYSDYPVLSPTLMPAKSPSTPLKSWFGVTCTQSRSNAPSSLFPFGLMLPLSSCHHSPGKPENIMSIETMYLVQ